MKTILVTGGTGTLGRVVTDRLLDAGHEVRVLSRHPAADRRDAAAQTDAARAAEPQTYAVDLRDTGAGARLDAAVTGADAIVHCASSPRGGDADAARHLIEAARRAKVPHLVYISIVGVDRVPMGYYRTKFEAERLIEDSGLGWTVLRTTQFHDLVLRLWQISTRLPLAPVPAGVRIQPIDVREVGERLAEAALGEPAGRVPEMGGPQVRDAGDLARAYLRAAGRRRALLPVRLPGKAFAGFRAGAHLPPDRAVGRVTFEEFLAERFSRPEA
ncbi:SDR family oxidoreductase [Streptomyces sp. H27-D2]|uniref:SDR family oxidoreductase n=1 Tax=Streptomyces sp. H27-D2 TaxID=3046304 RepID=UPI002DBCAEF2|nr:SDR family oxidoreductase [Streptomyces sp. H27-D2]MEC4015514.1 SDR family oxidoreductase [Streptomyces sp. H27-D2]